MLTDFPKLTLQILTLVLNTQTLNYVNLYRIQFSTQMTLTLKYLVKVKTHQKQWISIVPSRIHIQIFLLLNIRNTAVTFSTLMVSPTSQTKIVGVSPHEIRNKASKMLRKSASNVSMELYVISGFFQSHLKILEIIYMLVPRKPPPRVEAKIENKPSTNQKHNKQKLIDSNAQSLPKVRSTLCTDWIWTHNWPINDTFSMHSAAFE